MSGPKYTRPLSPAVAHWADRLDANAREFFEERAAIYEFDGGMNRRDAEAAAKAATEAQFGTGGTSPPPPEKTPKSRK